MRVSVIMCVHEDDRPGPLRDAVTSILSQLRYRVSNAPYRRRATWDRAIGELRVRIRAMNELCMVSLGNVAWTGAYLALRFLPVNLVRRAYRYLRPQGNRP